jgi:3-oxoacyl-[acyl-carrier-protein] synthase-3
MIGIGRIASTLGRIEPLEALGVFQADPGKLEGFRSMGMRKYASSSQSQVDLAFESVRKTLEGSPVPAERIDALLYCTENGAGYGFYGQFAGWCARLGLKNAFPLGLFMAGCGNFGSALNLARGLLANGTFRNILLVTVYVELEGEARRLMEPSVGILGDGSASCLMSAEEPLEFRLEHTRALAMNDLGTISPSREFLRYNLENYKGRKRIFDEFYAETAYRPGDFKIMITNNYGLNTQKGFASESGLPMEAIFMDNIPRWGHIQTSDVLINLASATPSLSRGETALLLSTGPTTWAIGIVSKN